MSEVSKVARAYGASDGPELIRILADAFSDDPILSWIMGREGQAKPLFRRKVNDFYLKSGIGHIVGDAEGCTLWCAPGVSEISSTFKQWHFIWDFYRAGGKAALARGAAVGQRMAKAHPKEPHYYLFAIGVQAASQGKGLGRELLAPMLERCDAEAMPAYLENSKERNLGFYQAHGFEVMGEGPFVPAPGCPPMWPMWRTPQKR